MSQNPQFLTLLTSKCASHHNGVHFFDIGWPSDRQKVVRTPGVLPLFTSKCASRHNGVHFFDIATSKSGPNPRCFATFYFQMCFAPQRRALFRHRNVQKWSEDPRVLTLFTSKCASRHNGVHFFHISTSKSRSETRRVLTLFTSKCASRHNGVYFFNISTSKSRPTLTCFDTFYFKMCFAPQRRALFPHLNFQKWSETDVF